MEQMWMGMLGIFFPYVCPVLIAFPSLVSCRCSRPGSAGDVKLCCAVGWSWAEDENTVAIVLRSDTEHDVWVRPAPAGSFCQAESSTLKGVAFSP